MIPTEVDYTIKEGDTLSEIAQDRGTTVEELQQLNNIPDSKKNKIFAGDTIRVPVKKLTATQAALRRGLGNKVDYGEGIEVAGAYPLINALLPLRAPPLIFTLSPNLSCKILRSIISDAIASLHFCFLIS